MSDWKITLAGYVTSRAFQGAANNEWCSYRKLMIFSKTLRNYATTVKDTKGANRVILLDSVIFRFL